MPSKQRENPYFLTVKGLQAGFALCLVLTGCAGQAVKYDAPVAPAFQGADRERGGTEIRSLSEMAVKNGQDKAELDRQDGVVRGGDLVRGNYTVTLDDGSLVSTTLPAVAGDIKVGRSGSLELPKDLVPVEVLAGEKGTVPGLGEGVIGMAAGERKRLALTADKAYGERDERKVSRQPRENTIPRTIRVPAKEYVERFNTFPIVGKEVPFVPYVTARVGEVGEADARLDISGKDGARFEESFGTVELHVNDETIALRLNPKIGASIAVQGEQGRVTAADDDTYTVDFNHPLAGKRVNIDLELVSVTKADAFKGVNVSWLENHDQGLAVAKQAEKPAVLVLYAEWCQWCKKLFGETVQDLRIKGLKESFVWVRVNSDQQAEYKAKYGQNGFPMIVLLHPDGTIAGKIDGFRDGAALAGELRRFLAEGGRKPVL
jgi:FKBP-type peptidyl-prolyl cis-trans isomerase 2